jgi:hypothetical protein
MSEITRSAEIGKLVGALCKAQLAFDPILKESENPAFVRKGKASKYADMFSLVSATRKHLNANGLTIMQFPTVTIEGKTLVVTTILAHESGEFVSHELLIPAADERGFTAHSIGKAMTYARRYSWGAITGAVAEDDDDGNDASGVGSRDASQTLGAKKVDDLKAQLEESLKAPQAMDPTASLFYVWFDDSQTAEITGHRGLMKSQEDLLRRLKLGGKLIANLEQLETLKIRFEERGVPFAPLKAM